VRVNFYGHACLKVWGERGAVLLDPWLAREGAFGSWFQFPENSPLADEALRDVSDICISHHHNDHLDPISLRRACALNPSLTLHVPRYPTPWFIRRARRLLGGVEERIVEHSAWEPFSTAAGVVVFFVPEESPASVDSAIICRAEGRSLINLNDSRLNSDQLQRIRATAERADFLTLQGSGASEYPINYTYPPEEMRARSLRKRRDKFDLCKEIIRLLQPERVLFFAGPPVFLDPALSHLRHGAGSLVFPDQLEILSELERDCPDVTDRAFFLLPGEELCERFLWKVLDRDAERLEPYTRKEKYLAAYAERRKDLQAFDPGEPPDEDSLLAYFRAMATLSPYLADAIGGEFTFVVKGRTREAVFTVDFAAGAARRGASPNPLYVLSAPASSVSSVLAGRHTWDDVFLSFRMSFDERTSRFIAQFKTLLRYMDAELFTELERYERRLRGEESSTPMIEVECAGEKFRIQRHCPHAGSDLEHHGRVDGDATITCLAHRFRFDLRTGECRNASRYRLKVDPPALSGEST